MAAAISANKKMTGFSGSEVRRLAMEEGLHKEEEVVAATAPLDVSVAARKLGMVVDEVVDRPASEDRAVEARVVRLGVG